MALSLGLVWPASGQALPMTGKDTSLIERADASVQLLQQGSAYREGLEALVRRDFARAEQAFRQASKANPKSAVPILGLAEVAFKRNDLKSAGRFIDQAVSLEPDNYRVQSSLGRYLVVTKQFAKAEAALAKAASLSADAAGPHLDLGDFYATVVNKPREAAAAYADAIKLDPNHAGAHYALGNALARLGENQKAIEYLTQSSRLGPQNPLPHVALGRIQMRLNSPGDALKSANLALAIQPGLVSARELRADALAAQGDPANALKEYEALARNNPKHADSHLKAGVLYQRLGRADQAVAAYKAALAANPRLALAYNNLAWLAVDRNRDLAQAEAWAKRATELAPNNAQFHDTLGWVYRATGKTRDALHVLEQAHKLDPSDASINYHLGVVLNDSGDTARAIEAFKTTVSLSPKSAEATQAMRLLNKLERK
jgi:tetratricopeptide (TPR) repeat protein